jgi:hypothetical protein
MSPFSLSDSELSEVLTLAAGVPVAHREAFLQSVCNALSAYPDNARGLGLIHREAAKLQRFWANAPAMRSEPRGVTSRYR